MKFKNTMVDDLTLLSQSDKPELKLLVSNEELLHLKSGIGFALFRRSDSINNLELESEDIVFCDGKVPLLSRNLILLGMLDILLQGVSILCVDSMNTYKLDVPIPFTNQTIPPITNIPKSEFTENTFDRIALNINGWTELVPEITQPVSWEVNNG